MPIDGDIAMLESVLAEAKARIAELEIERDACWRQAFAHEWEVIGELAGMERVCRLRRDLAARNLESARKWQVKYEELLASDAADHYRNEALKLEDERDALRAQLAEAQAGAAVMRQVIESFIEHDDITEYPKPDGSIGSVAREALATSAGAAAAERMRRLERVYEAARRHRRKHDTRTAWVKDKRDLDDAIVAVAELDKEPK